jgi:hypothetical protein
VDEPELLTAVVIPVGAALDEAVEVTTEVEVDSFAVDDVESVEAVVEEGGATFASLISM